MAARSTSDATGIEMTTKTRTTTTKGWAVTSEMRKRLPELMFGIAAGSDESARERIAAAKVLLDMVQQDSARRKAEPPSGRPIVRVELPENDRAARRAGR